jgi:hypothetical protein
MDHPHHDSHHPDLPQTLPPGTPVIFLDIDGPLNSVRSAIAFGGAARAGSEASWDKLDPVAAGLIAWAARETKACIVLSSSWRMNLWDKPMAFARLANFMHLPPILGVIRSGGHQTRAEDIDAWIGEHPEIGEWAIVDDIQTEAFLPHQRNRVVQVDAGPGFSLTNAKHLQALLSGDTEGAWKLTSKTLVLLS